MEDTFTINRLGRASLQCCLATASLIESSNSGMRLRTRRVTRWGAGQMILRWAAAAYLKTEKHFRRIMSYRSLWILEAALQHGDSQGTAAVSAWNTVSHLQTAASCAMI